LLLTSLILPLSNNVFVESVFDEDDDDVDNTSGAGRNDQWLLTSVHYNVSLSGCILNHHPTPFAPDSDPSTTVQEAMKAASSSPNHVSDPEKSWFSSLCFHLSFDINLLFGPSRQQNETAQ
jgi:hypothetical protein